MDRKEYLKELSDEHEEVRRLFRLFEPVVEARGVEDIAFVRGLLDELKGVLVSHVEREDSMFYRDLRERALQTGQEALLPALDLYMESMHKVSKRAVEFFETYADDSAILDEPDVFCQSLGVLSRDILDRIKSEEGSLFYIYRAYFFDTPGY